MYSPKEINEFQMKDKRIIFQSIFSSLCTLKSGVANHLADERELEKIAFEIVEDLIKVYPMMVIDEHIKNQSQGMPF